MAGIVSGTNEDLTYRPELAAFPGVLDPGNFKKLLVTDKGLNPNYGTLTTQPVQNNGMGGTVKPGFESVTGTTPFDWRLSNFRDLMQMHLGNIWVTGVAPATQGDLSITVAGTVATIGSVAAQFIIDGYEVGDVVDTALFTTAANNRRTILLTVAAGSMTVFSPPANPFVTEGADADATIAVVGEKIKIGTTLETWSMERGFVDAFLPFLGMATTDLSMTAAVNAALSGSASWIGMIPSDKVLATIAAGVDAIVEQEPLDSLNVLSRLYAGSDLIGSCKGFGITMPRPRTVPELCFAQNAPCVLDAPLTATGTLSTLFGVDEAEYTKLKNRQAFGFHALVFDDTGTNFLKVTAPNSKYTGVTIPSSQTEVQENLTFAANPDAVTGTNIMFQTNVV